MIGKLFIYLMIDPQIVNGRRRMYVGLTTMGIKRIYEHLTLQSLSDAHGSECARWVIDMIDRQVIPYCLVLEEANSLKELQILEIAYIKVLKLLQVELVNATDGGEAGSSRKENGNPAFDPYIFLKPVITEVHSLFRAPDEEDLEIDKFLTELSTKNGGINLDIERFRIRHAKARLSSAPSQAVDLTGAPAVAVGTTPPIVKGVRMCAHHSSGCLLPHHSGGLCKKHYDKTRKHTKKAKPVQKLSEVQELKN